MSTGPSSNYCTSPLPQGSNVDSAKGARRRFMGGLAIALIIYITLSVHNGFHVKASDAPHVGRRGADAFQQIQIPGMGHGRKNEKPPPIADPRPDDLPGPSQGDGEIIECTTSESWSPEPSLMATSVPWKIQEEHVAYTTFSMPLDAPSHYFLSRGEHAAGTFTLEDDDELDGDKFYIRVQASWRHEVAMQSSQLCLLRKQSGSIGLGIYVSLVLQTPHSTQQV